jgi:HEAT repeat protein
MPLDSPHKAAPLKDSGAGASACTTALAATYKALKAFTFYPEGHPLRERIVLGAHQAMLHAVRDGMLSLIVHRNGFSFADRQLAVETTPMTQALAQELFAREIQRFIVLPDLSRAEYTGFLALLALDPSKIIASGGLAALLKQNGIERVALDEIDISAVFTRKKAEQTEQSEAEQAFDSSASQAPAQEGSPVTEGAQLQGAGLPDNLSQLGGAELIALMSAERDDQRYRQLSRLLLARGLALKQERGFDQLFALLVGLEQQGNDPSRSAASRGQALSVLQQLGVGEMAEHLLDHLESVEFGRQEAVYAVLAALGAEAVDPVVRRLIAAGLKASRKPLTVALLRIGPPAEPALLVLLRDGRWQVVTAAVAILAELGSRDAVQGLMQTAYHSDGRVRMESIRALAGIGGIEATAALIELLQDPNQAIGIHAATWLGNSRNQRALQPLLQLVLKTDLLGKTRALKKEALVAIGRLGDRRALDPLCKLVQRRYWILPSRWEELKPVAVEAIGHLGGGSARSFLTRLSQQGGQLARVSAAALEAMGKRNQDSNE